MHILVLLGKASACPVWPSRLLLCRVPSSGSVEGARKSPRHGAAAGELSAACGSLQWRCCVGGDVEWSDGISPELPPQQSIEDLRNHYNRHTKYCSACQKVRHFMTSSHDIFRRY